MIDDNGTPRTVATASGSVSVPTARVVAQWTYDAYGDVLSADYFAPHATCDIGHKGLFVDRLDMQQALQAGNYTTDTPPKLVPYSQAIYHNRNRTYAPNLGRFMQSDPNATGMVVLDALAYHGEAISPDSMAMDLQRLHGDGANFYQYIQGNPWMGTDVLGLYGTPFDTAMMGVSVGKMAFELGSQAGFYQTLDVEWAMDWGAADDGHSRLDNDWVEVLMDQFVEGEVTVSGALMAGKGTTVDMMWSAGRGADRFARAELHHIIPKFMGGLPDGALARIPRDLHRIAQDHLHSKINDLCKKELNVSPYSRGGGTAVQAALNSMNYYDLLVFRRRLYDVLLDFDMSHNTFLAREFSKEVIQQRNRLAAAGQPLRGILR